MGIEVRGLVPLLQVFDMPTSIKFYRDVLGFEVAATSKPGSDDVGWAMLKLDGGTDAQYGLRRRYAAARS